MKFYYQRPQKEIRTVKLGKDELEYEFWVLTPVRIGSARKVGTQQIITEDNCRFTNLQSAALHFLEQHEAAPAAAKVAHVPRETVEVAGMEIVAKGKWAEFCRMRKLNLTAAENVAKRYDLTRDELQQLGIAKEELQ